jgi:hypothetical protein
MKYAAEMVAGAMIYTSNFKKIGSAIQKLIEGIYRNIDIETACTSNKPTFFFLFK